MGRSTRRMKRSFSISDRGRDRDRFCELTTRCNAAHPTTHEKDEDAEERGTNADWGIGEISGPLESRASYDFSPTSEKGVLC